MTQLDTAERPVEMTYGRRNIWGFGELESQEEQSEQHSPVQGGPDPAVPLAAGRPAAKARVPTKARSHVSTAGSFTTARGEQPTVGEGISTVWSTRAVGISEP